MVEQRAVNSKVEGSSPSRTAIFANLMLVVAYDIANVGGWVQAPQFAPILMGIWWNSRHASLRN